MVRRVLGAGFMGGCPREAYHGLLTSRRQHLPSQRGDPLADESAPSGPTISGASSPTAASTPSTSACLRRSTGWWRRLPSTPTSTSLLEKPLALTRGGPRRPRQAAAGGSRLHGRPRAALLARVRGDPRRVATGELGHRATGSPRAGSHSRPGRLCSAAPIYREEP